VIAIVVAGVVVVARSVKAAVCDVLSGKFQVFLAVCHTIDSRRFRRVWARTDTIGIYNRTVFQVAGCSLNTLG